MKCTIPVPSLSTTMLSSHQSSNGWLHFSSHGVIRSNLDPFFKRRSQITSYINRLQNVAAHKKTTALKGTTTRGQRDSLRCIQKLKIHKQRVNLTAFVVALLCRNFLESDKVSSWSYPDGVRNALIQQDCGHFSIALHAKRLLIFKLSACPRSTRARSPFGFKRPNRFPIHDGTLFNNRHYR